MKIATKLVAGQAILLLLIVATLAYQASRIDRLETINRNLAAINFKAATITLRMFRDIEQVDEFTLKYFVTTGDQGYARRLGEARDAFSEELQDLKRLPLSHDEQARITQVANLWARFLDASLAVERSYSSRTQPELEAALAGQIDLLAALRNQTQDLTRANRQAIDAQIEESALNGRRAARISRQAGIAALALGLFVSVWVLSSVLKPLRRLTDGTRAVARGDFSYRLEATGQDEFSGLARDFNSMTRRLGELDEIKKDFVTHISHEFKSPLACVQETHRLLLEQIPGILNERQRQLLEVNQGAFARLSLMIENLLDLARLEAGVMQYDIRQHDLAALVRTALAEFAPQAAEKGFQLGIELPPDPVLVECDGNRIIQVMSNLLGNALKFSRAGTAIRVELGRAGTIPDGAPSAWRRDFALAPASGGLVWLSVADSGPGVPEEEREKVFEKFHRTKRTQKLAGGAGLGLAISRSIIEAHSGTIWVSDNDGQGSKFSALWPARARSRQQAAGVPSFSSDLS